MTSTTALSLTYVLTILRRNAASVTRPRTLALLSESYNFWKVSVGLLLVRLYENLSKGVHKSCLEGFRFRCDCLQSSLNLFVIGLSISPPLSLIALSLAPKGETSCNKSTDDRTHYSRQKLSRIQKRRQLLEAHVRETDYSFFAIALK
jgi:hypothetical protein